MVMTEGVLYYRRFTWTWTKQLGLRPSSVTKDNVLTLKKYKTAIPKKPKFNMERK